MAERSQMLATRFEEAVAEFISFVQPLAESQWRTLCPNEERTVGVLARHVAASIPFQMTVFREIANGRQPETITTEQLAEMNADDARAWASCSKDETLALLRNNGAAAADEVRRLHEEQLGRTGKYVEDWPGDWTVEQWIDRVLIGHVHDHLASIRAVVGRERE